MSINSQIGKNLREKFFEALELSSKNCSHGNWIKSYYFTLSYASESNYKTNGVTEISKSFISY